LTSSGVTDPGAAVAGRLTRPPVAARIDCRPGADHLTDREIEVLLLVAVGGHNKQIAKELGISTRTVDHHLRTMLRKVGAESRSELVARCYAAGLMIPAAWPPAWSGSRCLRAGPEPADPADPDDPGPDGDTAGPGCLAR